MATKNDKARWQQTYYKKLKAAVFAFYGDKCARCSFTDPRALQIDHINGDGVKDRARFSRGKQRTAFFKWILAHPENYQILCANCNWIKRDENQEWAKS